MKTYLTWRGVGRSIGFLLCVSLLASACGEEEEDEPGDGELGSECKLGATECDDGLECTESESGGMCTIVAR